MEVLCRWPPSPLPFHRPSTSRGRDATVGGATSIGAAHQFGFELFYAVEPIEEGQPAARRVFNGLDLDAEVGSVGEYIVAARGLA